MSAGWEWEGGRGGGASGDGLGSLSWFYKGVTEQELACHSFIGSLSQAVCTVSGVGLLCK